MIGASLSFGQSVYVANFGSNNISTYSITAGTGVLVPVAGSPFTSGGGNPQGVAADPSGQFVYVVNNGAKTVSAYTSTAGVLAGVGTAAATGNNPNGIAADPLGRFVYVVNTGDTTVSGYVITQGVGNLTPIGTVNTGVGTGPTEVTVDPSGRFVYVTNNTVGKVLMFTINASTGTLTPGTPVSTGPAPIGVAVDPAGRFLFVANSGDNTISRYSIASNGTLSSLGAATPTGGTAAARLTVDPTGKYLYLVNTTSHNVSGFSIGPNAVLTGLAGSPYDTGGTTPASLTAEPTGKYLYVTNQTSGNVTGFGLTAGVPAALAGSPYTAGTTPFGIASRTLAPASQFVVSAPATANAGTAINVTVTAEDAFGNVVLGYGGTVHFTSTDTHATLPADATLTNGTGTFAVTLKTAGSQTVTATDVANPTITGVSSGIAVSGGAATQLSIVAPTPVNSGLAFNFTVSAQDQFGNTDSNYAGTVHFTTSDGGATLPADSTLTSGTAILPATLVHPVTHFIIGTDTVTASITGLSNIITVIVPPVIAKAYSPNPVPVGGTTALVYTVNNPNTTVALAGLAFTDTLPAGTAVASPTGLSGSCGGSVSTSAGASSVTLTGGSLIANTSCSISVNVIASAVGTLTSATSNVTSTNGGTGNAAGASLVVTGTAPTPPTVSMAFGAGNIALNGSTSLTITITNPAANTASLINLSFVDTLPTGLFVSSISGLTNTCGGTATATAGSNSIVLTGGALNLSSSCSVSASITGTASGNYTNSVSVTSSTPGTTTATATLHVNGTPGPQNFQQIGTFRPIPGSVAQFSLDNDGDYFYQTGDKVKFFGLPGDIPVAGDWTGTGSISIGVFRCPTAGVCQWYIDANNNGQWDGVAGGDVIWNFGLTGDLPAVGDWTGDGISKIAVMRCPPTGTPGVCTWYLDAGNKHTYDPATVVTEQYGLTGDLPAVNNWLGSGPTEQVGVFRCPAAGVCTWIVDSNANGAFDLTDAQYTYGITGDRPIVGNWFGTGRKRIGVFRGGILVLNVSGSNAFINGIDFMGSFGLPGDLPVIGFWTMQ
jgi:6-phosphogluconolactonase (cycloisomerase 2 family)